MVKQQVTATTNSLPGQVTLIATFDMQTMLTLAALRPHSPVT